MNESLSPQDLINLAMDAFLYNNDLGGASYQAGDEIAGLVWSYIEEVVEEGRLTEVIAIVDEASQRADEEIDEILEQDRIDQDEMDDDDEDETDETDG